MEKLTRTERIARWFSNRWNSLVCLVHGHQDFGVGFGGADCLRCGRKSRWELGALPLPRLTQPGDPNRHRLETGHLRKSVEVSGDGYARALTVGDVYERTQQGGWHLTPQGRQRLEAIGWVKPGDTITVDLLTEEEARQNETLAREMVRQATYRAYLREARTKGVH